MESMTPRRWRILLSLLALTTGVYTLWELHNGQRSEYYAAIAVSMSQSWSNWFFGALDPAGTVTLDKIPGSYWIPAIFVRLFGFSTWAVDAPNAIATIASVVIVARAIKRHWGAQAGLIAGAAVATTPILIAVGRSNQPQTFFILTLALAMDRALTALMSGSRRSLIAAGAWIGVAFHTYMLEAWALWPALIIAWLVTTGTWRKKLMDLLIAGSVSMAISLTWIVAAWLTPTGNRPYIGGTYHNNPWEMVFGYNGLGRFTATSTALSSTTDDPTFRSFTPPFGGPAGIGRLFSDAVASQIAWLIPAAVVAVGILWVIRRWRPTTVFLGMWLITFAAMFSAVGGIHQFYVSSLALPIAALLGMVFALGNKRAHVAVATIAAATALWVSWGYASYYPWAPLVQVAAAIFLAAALFIPDLAAPRTVVASLTATALLFTPAVWSLDARNHASSINPVAGPAGMGGPGNGLGNGPGGGQGQGGPGGGFGQSASAEVIAYLQANRNGATYLAAAFGGMSAAGYITTSGEPVLPIGGFDGQDPVPTLDEFKALVANGQLRYVLGDHQGAGPQRTNDIATWVQQNCTVDSAAPAGATLYLCSGASV